MLRTVLSRAVTISRLTTNFRRLTYRGCLCGIKDTKAFEEVRTHMISSLEEYEEWATQSENDVQKGIEFFNSQGYEVVFRSKFVQISKKIGPYNITIVVKAHAKMDLSQNAKDKIREAAKEMGQDNPPEFTNQSISEVALYILKDGNQNTLLLNFITVGKKVDMHEHGFVKNWRDDIDHKEKGLRPAMTIQGPQKPLMTKEFQESLFEFLNNLECKPGHLILAGELGGLYQLKMHTKWTEELKKML